MALILMWMIVMGINVMGANSQLQGCEAIISGPLTGDGLPHLLITFNINGTHPALVRCHVTCLNPQGYYNPTMALFITSREELEIVPGASIYRYRDGLLIYEIHFRRISSCEAQNNYTMEFEYLIYSNSSDIDDAVLQCGVRSFINQLARGPCLGQSIGIINLFVMCDPGFTSDGNNLCIDNDECNTDEHNCDENAECINTEGSFECVCQPSFFGDGVTCLRGISPFISRTNTRVKPKHELQYNIGTDFCLEDPTTNFYLWITCLLIQDPLPPPEFQWILNSRDLSSEVMYHYHGLSVYQDGNTLTLNGTLDQLNNSLILDIICVVENMYGNDTESTSINLCGPTQCQDGVTNNCTQECSRNVTNGVHECSCRPGYEFALGSNSICEDINECDAVTLSDCPFSSICTNLNGSFECMCVNGTRMDHTGNCYSTDFDECLEGYHNCSQHATCNSVDGGYTCKCVFGFEGNGVNCTFSRAIIIGTSGAAFSIVAVIFLVMIITGCIKIIVKNKSIPKNENHEMDVILNGASLKDSISVSTSAVKSVKLRGSLKEKLTLSFTIKSTNLKIMDPIGQGEYGIVYKGYVAYKYTDEVVAIKTLKGFVDDYTVEELLRECDKMKNLHHQHVMTLKGVCLDGGPVPYLILPYMANGSVLSYIRREQSNLVIMEEADVEANNGETLSQVYIIKKRLMDMCLQVAKGMEYLASEKLIHRDLAARNCMIDINMVIKVADFGLAVHTGDKDYYRLSANMGVKLPVMWMAPESLTNCVFSEMSDVWSYGVTCWEMFTGGQAPYAGTKPSSLLSLLQDGERLETPRNSACSTDMYSMMLQCWEMEPAKRPSFSALVQTLSKTLEEMAGYLHVGAFTDLDSSTGQAEQIIQKS